MIPVGQEMPASCRCRFCGKPIVMGRVIRTGKRIPLDPLRASDDDPAANAAVSTDHLGSVYVRLVSRTDPLREPERRFHTHFETCTARVAARRRRGRKG